MPEQNKRSISRERVGEISFLLTKLALKKITFTELAESLGIPLEEMSRYVEALDSDIDVTTLHHWADCPVCVLGEVRFQNIEFPSRRVHLKCNVCQTNFYREHS